MAANHPETARSESSRTISGDSLPGLISDLELHLISQKISRHHWEELGLRLGFAGVELENIRFQNRYESPQRAIYDMLIQWKQNQPGEQRDVLLQALLDCRLRDLAESFADGIITSPILDLDVEQLRKELTQFYLSDMCKIKFIPWDDESYVDLEMFYVRLSVVLQDTSMPNIILNGPKRFQPLQDSYDGIFSASTSQSNQRPPMRLLLEGEAGIGKSTLIAKLAYDWATCAESSPLKDIPLFIAIPFRKWNPEWTIGTAVRKCLLAMDSTISAKQIDNYIKVNPAAVKVVLEGYDEAAFSISDEEASGCIGRILRSKELRDSQVLVTTRPWRVEDFKGFLRTYSRIAIEGFQKEEVEKYIRFFFQGQNEKAEHLLKYIDEHPAVSGFLSGIPLFTAMLCELTNEIQTEVDDLDEFDTISDLFRYFTSYLWGHYDTKSNSARSPEESEATLTILLLHLGRIGLDGLFSPDKKLLFDSSDFITSGNKGNEIAIVDDVDDLACKVGILSKHRRKVQLKLKMKQRTVTDSHALSFFHKLGQEYCAGIYLGHLAQTDEKAFNSYLRKICSRAQLLEYKNVLLFACGEGTHSARLVLEHLVLLQEKMVYLWDTNDNAMEIALLGNLESKSNGQLNTSLKRFFKSSNLDVFVSPFKHEPHVSVAYRYLLSSGESLPMEGCEISISKDKHLSIFFDFLTVRNATSLTGLKLDVSNLEEDSYLRFIKSLQSFHNLHRLSLSVKKSTNITQLNRAPGSCVYPSVRLLEIQSESVDSFDVYLKFTSDRFPNVEELSIDKASIRSCSDMTKQNKVLHFVKTLNVKNLACGDQPLSIIFNVISQFCPTAIKINITVEDRDIHVDTQSGMGQMKQLQCLGLTLNVTNQLTFTSLMNFIKSYAPSLKIINLEADVSFESNTEIPTSVISNSIESASFKHTCKSEDDLRKMMQHLPNVKSVKMTSCEPFRKSRNEPNSEMVATNARNLEVNCSSLAFTDTIPNFFVQMNSIQNSEVTALNFLSLFRNITSLSLVNLPYRTLDLGSCPEMPNVHHLQVHGFFLQCGVGLCSFFRKFPQLVSCQVPFTVNDDIIGDLVDGLRDRTNLRLLVVGIESALRHNIEKMVQAIATLPSLEHLVFRINSFYDTVFHSLATVLPTWTRLTFLGIHPYQMKDQPEPAGREAMDTFVDACVTHESLSILDLSLFKLTKEATLHVLAAADSAYGSTGQLSLRFTGPHLPCDWEVYSAVDLGRDKGYVTLVPPDKKVRYGEFHGGVGPTMGMHLCGVSLQTACKDVMYWQSVGCPDIDAIFGNDNDAVIVADHKDLSDRAADETTIIEENTREAVNMDDDKVKFNESVVENYMEAYHDETGTDTYPVHEDKPKVDEIVNDGDCHDRKKDDETGIIDDNGNIPGDGALCC